ncbi:hypothetical protein PV325_006166 [Microctonus aethiopoides]|nr:hypothetical protein PV325_006166 [Microctonus aethiopoides]
MQKDFFHSITDIDATTGPTANLRTVPKSGENFLQGPLMFFWQHLSVGEVARLVTQEGYRYKEVGEQLGASPSVVFRAYNRYLKTDRYERRAGQGRYRVTTRRDDHTIQTTTFASYFSYHKPLVSRSEISDNDSNVIV